MKKTIELKKTGLGRQTVEIVNISAIERLTLLSEETLKAERQNAKTSPLPSHLPGTVAAAMANEQAGILRLTSGAELPVVDEELAAVLSALNEQ
jgi:hypothetical protein